MNTLFIALCSLGFVALSVCEHCNYDSDCFHETCFHNTHLGCSHGQCTCLYGVDPCHGETCSLRTDCGKGHCTCNGNDAWHCYNGICSCGAPAGRK